MTTYTPEVAAAIQEAFDTAVAHYRSGRFEAAEELYRAILQLDPQHPNTNYNLGLIAMQFNRAQDAVAFFKAALMAAPLLVHALVTTLAARATGVGVTFRTQLDGLLLQGYFTGAGSFLPLATDVEYRGDEAAKARTATIALLSLLAVHLVLAAVGRGLGLYPFTFAGAAVLMYCFVFSFPLAPLEGHHLWQRSKLLWLAVWLPTLVAFLANMPDVFAEVL